MTSRKELEEGGRMKDWQFFFLLAAIYGLPTMDRKWAIVLSAFSMVVSIASYYAGSP